MACLSAHPVAVQSSSGDVLQDGPRPRVGVEGEFGWRGAGGGGGGQGVTISTPDSKITRCFVKTVHGPTVGWAAIYSRLDSIPSRCVPLRCVVVLSFSCPHSKMTRRFVKTVRAPTAGGQLHILDSTLFGPFCSVVLCHNVVPSFSTSESKMTQSFAKTVRGPGGRGFQTGGEA